MKHYTVLKSEAIEKLKINKDGIYVDATLGLGGHSEEIAKKLNGGKLICFDQDEKAIEFSKNRLSKYKNVLFVKSNFKNLKIELEKININKIDGIIYDLGTSYYQLTDEDRGFSYHGENIELDMRMDLNLKIDAKHILNNYSQEELSNIFWKYADEKYSRKIAEKIIEYRENKELKTNTELNKIIKDVKGFQEKHPSKQVYQALRIEVNKELDVISESLLQAMELLNKDGRIAVITFHSLEDKVVKEIFWNSKKEKIETLFETSQKYRTLKTVYPTKDEININNPSRSAKLRTLVKNYE